MKQKIIQGLLGTLAISGPLHATHSSFYVGLNGTNTVWHVKQNLNFDATKFATPGLASSLSGDLGNQRYLLNGEIVAGIKASNGSVYGALETWYNPNSNKVNIGNANINFSTTIANRWGGRLLAGVQTRSVTLYGIVGIGQSKIATETSFPAGGIYGTIPGGDGGALSANNFASNELMFSAGIGLSAMFYDNWEVALEYQHHQAENSAALNNTIANVGTQTATIKGDSINFTVKYQFKSYKI